VEKLELKLSKGGEKANAEAQKAMKETMNPNPDLNGRHKRRQRYERLWKSK